MKYIFAFLFLSSLVCLGYAQESKPIFEKPVETKIEGWTVRVDKKLIAEKEKHQEATKALANHLQRVKYIVPEKRVDELQKLPIWLDLKNKRLTSMQYHPSAGWLEKNGHDPALEKHVHIPIAADLTSRSQWAKHPYVVLHELAHSYHDQVLGFDHAEVKRVFNAANDEGIYDEVLDHAGRKVKHYALSNHKEYFAEMTEAYFGVNDFFPFVRAELKQHDPRMYSLLEKIWGKVR